MKQNYSAVCADCGNELAKDIDIVPATGGTLEFDVYRCFTCNTAGRVERWTVIARLKDEHRH
jgi:DNA-directed RNA polymerase subunit RPC12/RpoP